MAGNGKDAEVANPRNKFQAPLASAQRERFCQAIVGGMTPTEAHKYAGYISKHGAKRATQASKLKKVTDVHLRIVALQALAAAQTVESVAWSQGQVMGELKTNVDQARKGYPILARDGSHSGMYRPDYAAVNRALELYGKQLGMFKETLLVGSAEDRALDAMDDEEVRILQEAYDRIEQHRRCAGARPVGPGAQSPATGAAADVPAIPETATIP